MVDRLKDRGMTLLAALLLDTLLGDPPNRYHPVAWMGAVIAAMQRRAPKQGEREQLAYGALLTAGGMGAAAGAGWLAQRLIDHLPRPLRWLLGGLLLKMMLSLRGLGTAAGDVQSALDANDLPEARRLVSWHLVSRDTSALAASGVAAATVESVAENTSDGVIAPLLHYSLGGLPAALAYRFANTADAMLGYRDAAREWLGKVPARTDDVLNLLPARLTALLFIASARLAGGDGSQALRTWQRDRNLTDSPNAGHPMSAAAGALGVSLTKSGQYTLGAGNRPPQAADIGRSVNLMRAAVVLGAAIISAVLILLPGREDR